MRRYVSEQDYLTNLGFFAQGFESGFVDNDPEFNLDTPNVILDKNIKKVSDGFDFHFMNAGVMVDNEVWTRKVLPKKEEPTTLRDMLQKEKDVDEAYYINGSTLKDWEYLKGAKDEERTARSGHVYNYKEGALPFPEDLDQPARTILTNEGGVSPSRFKHLIKVDGRYRRLTPIEVERLNGFKEDWTKGMPEGARYFCMGNALVVGLVERMGKILRNVDPRN